eukprot:c17478_g1_i1.p1 GENE.c17478_g1_i1~~c17478_g1_i1.p1  ORF type:complete len:373 (+),score=135.52 c17478_g1_i1:38-1156(+)
MKKIVFVFILLTILSFLPLSISIQSFSSIKLSLKSRIKESPKSLKQIINEKNNYNGNGTVINELNEMKLKNPKKLQTIQFLQKIRIISEKIHSKSLKSTKNIKNNFEIENYKFVEENNNFNSFSFLQESVQTDDVKNTSVIISPMQFRRKDITERVNEAVCQRQLLQQMTDGVWRDIRDTIQETILSQIKTEDVMNDIILPIGECIAYGIVHELADTVAQQFLFLFEAAFNSIVPDGIQLLFAPLLTLYLLKGLGRTLTVSISDPLQIFLNRDLVETVTVQLMGYLSTQGDPQLAHAVTHIVTEVVAKGAVQAITHSLTHGITHAVTHTVTHEVIHQYYCIYCHYYNRYCNQCYHYADDPTLHRIFQVDVAE